MYRTIQLHFPTIFFHRAIDVLSVPIFDFLFLVPENRLNAFQSTLLSREKPLKVFSREDVFNPPPSYFIVSFPSFPC